MAGKPGLFPVVAPYRWIWLSGHAGCMSLGQVAIDLWMTLVAASLATIVAFLVTGVLAALATTVASRRRARRVSAELGALSRWSSVRDLADIDEALDRVLMEDHSLLMEDHSLLR